MARQRHLIFKITLTVSLFFILLMISLPIFKLLPFIQEQKVIPLHYNVYFGVDLIGPWYQIFYLPTLGLILLVANSLFEELVYQKEQVLSYFFSIATLLSEIILLLAVLLITLLNL